MTTAGAPLLLLHGFLGAPAVWSPLQLDPSRVFAPLLVGHRGAELVPGRSPAQLERFADPRLQPPAQVSAAWGLAHGGFNREVDRLAQWARECGFERGTLCGYSLGARLALGLLRRHPGLFTRALFVSVHPGLDSAAERELRLKADLEHCRSLEREGTEAFVARWEGLPLFATRGALPRSTLDAQRQLRLAHSPEGLAQSLLQCGLASMPTGAGLGAPADLEVSVLAGGLDDKFARLALGLGWPEARVEIVPGAGHNLVLEHPELLRARLD